MATQCLSADESNLNPLANDFHPSNQWTVMNHPRFNSLCRYHSHESGNHCLYGSACWYVHAAELHRPTYAEQQASLLQAVLSILAFAVSCLQQPQFPPPTTSGFAAQQTTAEHDDADVDDTADPDSANSHLQPKDASGADVNGDEDDDDDDDDADYGPRHLEVTFEDVLHVDADLDIPDNANLINDATLSFRNTLSDDKSAADENVADDDVKDVDYDRAQNLHADDESLPLFEANSESHKLAPDMPPMQLLLYKFLWAIRPST